MQVANAGGCRRWFFALLVVGGLFVFPSNAQSASEKSLRVAMVLPGAINDQGFNQAGYAGLKLIEEELGADTAYSEHTPIAEFEQVYRGFADQGYDVIIGHGFEFGDVALEVAPDYPDIKFIVGSHPFVQAENVAGLVGKVWETSYVCGYLAGLMTQSAQIGGIAGFDFPIIISQLEAYRLGAKAANPDVEVTNVYIGTFDDAAKGKEAAYAQISAGIDVIYHIADAAGVGVIQACEERDAYVIGFGLDQYHLAPDHVLTSMIFGNDRMYLLDVKKIVEGTWSGEARQYGMDTGVTYITDTRGNVPPEVIKRVHQIQQDILEGRLKVPYIPEKQD